MLGTILVVDDEPTVLHAIKLMLERAGYEVLTAFDGEQALDLCEQHPASIHLLLTDVNMPRINGAKLARCLSTVKPEMPVLFMTGFAVDTPEMHKLLRAASLKVCKILSKPFTSTELLAHVRQCI